MFDSEQNHSRAVASLSLGSYGDADGMKRNPAALGAKLFDVAVVGGGIYGVCVARDAALRGLSVALVERGDFGAATSFNSLKTIHGGFRYLQSADLWRLRESVRERRYWLWAAPHLVRPLRFVIPLGEGLVRGRLAFRAALAAYRLLSLDGNRGLQRDRSLPAGQVVGRDACRDELPGLGDQAVRGGVAWFDAQVVDTERLLLECLQQASEAGAVACNHVRALGLIEHEARVHGVRCEDVVDGAPLDVRARVTVDATGPFHLGAADPGEHRPLVKSMNLVLAGSEAEHAFGAGIPGSRRMVFVTPWRDCSIVGTSQARYRGNPDDCRFTAEDAEALMTDLRAALPGLDLGADRVLWRQGGLLPAAGAGRARGAVPAARGELIDHARTSGRHGLVGVVGEKYTTARFLAERAVDLCLRKLGQGSRPCVALRVQLPGAGAAVIDDRTGSAERWRLAVREEMAVTLDDLVFRRSDRAVRGRMSAEELEAAADVMADELGWSPSRRLQEIAATRRCAAGHGGVWAHAARRESRMDSIPAHARRAV